MRDYLVARAFVDQSQAPCVVERYFISQRVNGGAAVNQVFALGPVVRQQSDIRLIGDRSGMCDERWVGREEQTKASVNRWILRSCSKGCECFAHRIFIVSHLFQQVSESHPLLWLQGSCLSDQAIEIRRGLGVFMEQHQPPCKLELYVRVVRPTLCHLL